MGGLYNQSKASKSVLKADAAPGGSLSWYSNSSLGTATLFALKNFELGPKLSHTEDGKLLIA